MQLEQINNIIELEIPQDCAGLRLDQALVQLLPDHSRSRLQTWILAKQITVDNQIVSAKRKVWGGEKIKIQPVMYHKEAINIAEPLKLNIVL